ncbi:uncharacterized protein LOC134216837 isoform X2 [Armigeres subalbatus]|uniref:uncharacterized protein LOC134216837 isoform X2 n=1 Tax=Armigeres subalbatus TaxID=124917 RepID=UPI002ED2A166
MSNKLVEIPSENWEELRDLFARDWPEHLFAYGVINNYWNWKQQSESPDTNSVVKLFSLNGSWRENALSLVSWENYLEVSMDFVEKHRPALDRVISSKKLTTVNDKVTNFYHMPKEIASSMEVNLPNGYHLNRLTINHLDYIYHLWPLRDSISKTSGYNLLKRLILLNDSVGLFDAADKLVSWCLRDQTGAFSDLQTCQENLRQGYARVVVKEFVRRLAADGDDSYAFVLCTNVNSCKLFESIGFVKIAHLHWVVIRNKD